MTLTHNYWGDLGKLDMADFVSKDLVYLTKQCETV